MRRLPHPAEDRAFRAAAGTVGGILLASSGIAADLAREHMALLGVICGQAAVPHCGWCYAASGLLLAGLTALAVALAPGRPIAQRVPPDPQKVPRKVRLL
jgi:hypothetical protein